MNADDANRAARGQVIHSQTSLPTGGYVPVVGVPGSTLIEQFTSIQEMTRDGNATQNQVKEMMARLEAAFPGVDQSSAEHYVVCIGDLIQVFINFPEADQDYLLFRWDHCNCGGCANIAEMFRRVIAHDRTEDQ